MELFRIAGNEYYFDLDKICDFVKIDEYKPRNLDDLLTKEEIEDDENSIEEEMRGPLVDITKWDLVKAMVETVLSENGIVDDDMGYTMLGKQLSIPTRLSFNTLIKYNLIKNNK